MFAPIAILAAALTHPTIDPASLKQVGYLRNGLKTTTAFLVGRCEVLTSRHIMDRPKLGDRLPFRLPMTKQKSAATVTMMGAANSTVKLGYNAEDWMLLTLDNCLGDGVGYLPIASWVPKYADSWTAGGGGIVVAGYPNGWLDWGKPWMDPDCKVTDYRKDKITTNCMVFPGHSGSPVIGWHTEGGKASPYVVGILVTGEGKKRHSEVVPIPHDVMNAQIAAMQP